MNRSEIIDGLNAKYGGFAEFVANLSEAEFMFSLKDEKWTAGQQADHLCRSLAPLNKALKAPAIALKAMFGTADHPSVSYDELVARYQSELSAGASATPPFLPEAIAFDRRDDLLSELHLHLEKLCKNIENLGDDKFDKLVLPHPLLGKLTLREMFCFMIYHAEHHHLLTEKNLAAKGTSV